MLVVLVIQVVKDTLVVEATLVALVIQDHLVIPVRWGIVVA